MVFVSNFVSGSGRITTIDGTTSGSFPGTMTISNLTVGGALLSDLHTVQLTNAGTATPLTILDTLCITNFGGVVISNSALSVRGQLIDNDFLELVTGSLFSTNPANTYLGNGGFGNADVFGGTWQALNMNFGEVTGDGGVLTIAGGLVSVRNDMFIGFAAGSSGAISITGGELENTNGFTAIGESGSGEVTISNGVWLSASLNISDFGGAGNVNFAGGVSTTAELSVCSRMGGTATVWQTGGQLVAGESYIGDAGVGLMTISNGTFTYGPVEVGSYAFSQGTLTIAGGTTTFTATLHVAKGLAPGTIWITGGTLTVTNATTTVGDPGGVGQIIMSNGLWQSRFIFDGDSGEGVCPITLYGGTAIVYSNLNIGRFDCQGTGNVTVAGGALFVTNAAHNATLEVDSGTFTLSSGIVMVDRFVMTNACANFVPDGGTLIYTTAILDPTADADGDGIPNGYEQAHGLDPLDPSNVTMDSDGDGLTDLQEYLAGTDPTNAASSFRITSVTRTGNNVLIGWMMGPGKTNALQATNGGSYNTNGLADIFIVTNTVGTATNYLDVGGATNNPARYYRVRLVP